MEMVTNLRQFRHSRRKFLCHHVGLNGTETDAFNAFHFMYLTDDVCQGDGFQILAVTCHMDAVSTTSLKPFSARRFTSAITSSG